MNELTYDECDVILDALEKWENESDIGGMLIGSLFSSMIDDPEAKEEMKKEQEKREREKAIEKRERKRKSAKLKAKIYQIQEACTAREVGLE